MGMVYPDAAPVVVQSEDVRMVGEGGVPVALRDHAKEALTSLSGSLWWTVGEFRYDDAEGRMGVYTSAVARRLVPGGSVEFGIEVGE